MKVIADTGPLVAAANTRDQAHDLAAGLVTHLGPDLIVPEPVAVETDYLLRVRVGLDAARKFLGSLVSGEHALEFLTRTTFGRAVEIDSKFASLDLGIADTAVMALAERGRLPILTFDFEDFRATAPKKGFWRLVVDEAEYADAIKRTTS